MCCESDDDVRHSPSHSLLHAGPEHASTSLKQETGERNCPSKSADPRNTGPLADRYFHPGYFSQNSGHCNKKNNNQIANLPTPGLSGIPVLVSGSEILSAGVDHATRFDRSLVYLSPYHTNKENKKQTRLTTADPQLILLLSPPRMKGVRQVFGWPPRRGGDVATPPLPINTQNLQAGPQDPSPLPPHKSVPSSPIPVIYASSPQFFPDVEESKATEHIARPKNSFFFFRADFIKKKKTEIGKSKGVTQKHLSKLAGEAWRQLPLEEREVYDQMAAAARIEHARAHPDYKFRPKRKSRSSSSLRPSTSSGRKRQPRSPLPHSPVSTYGTPTSPLSAHDTDGSLFSLEVDDEHEPPYNSHRRSLSAPHFSKLLSEAPRLEFPSDTPHAEYRRSKSFTEGTSFMPVNQPFHGGSRSLLTF